MESQFIDNLRRTNISLARQHAFTRRFIDDLLCWNCEPPSCDTYGLQWLETSETDYVTFLGARIKTRSNGSFETSIFNKFEEWNFNVIKYPHMDSNVPIHQASGIVKGQLFRFRLICNSIKAFKIATTSLVSHMIYRGHNYRSIYKGWTAHLSHYNEDRFTNYSTLKAWFKKMLHWVEHQHRLGTLFTSSRDDIIVPAPTATVNTAPCASSPPTRNIAVTTTPTCTSTPPIVPPDHISPVSMATEFEVTYHQENPILQVQLPPSQELQMTSAITNQEIRSSQEAMWNLGQTSPLFYHLTIYKAFFAVREEFNMVTKIMRTMKLRWGRARTDEVTMNVKCQCGQYFVSRGQLLGHERHSNSNCARTKILHAKARNCIILEGDYLLLDSEGITSVATEDRCITNRDINFGIRALTKDFRREEHHFDLEFMHTLIDGTQGYNFTAVNGWTGDMNIFSKDYVYFSVAYNNLHILIVVFIRDRVIQAYDPATNSPQPELLGLILRYLYDEFQMMDEKSLDLNRPPLLQSFEIDNWSTENFFTPHRKFRHRFKPADGGIIHLKLIQLLHQETHDLQEITPDKIMEYRRELADIMQLFMDSG